MNTSKTIIQRSFSRASGRYDEFCGFHVDIAGQLIGRIKDVDRPEKILDAGMGTGILTKKIKEKFSRSLVVGVDMSSGMIDVAKNKLSSCPIVRADTAHLPFKENVFDLAVSNLSYQWEYDLKRAFEICRYVLKREGRIYFSIFGRNTLEELFVSLEEAFKLKYPQKKFFMDRLADEVDIVRAVSAAGFNDIQIENSAYRMCFPDMFELIKWIKGIGGNTLNRSYYAGKELLSLSNRHYLKHFKENGKVFATLEVIWVEARK